MDKRWSKFIVKIAELATLMHLAQFSVLHRVSRFKNGRLVRQNLVLPLEDYPPRI